MKPETKSQVEAFLNKVEAHYNFPSKSYGAETIKTLKEALNANETRELTVKIDGATVYGTFEPTQITKKGTNSQLFGNVSYAVFRDDGAFLLAGINDIDEKEFSQELFPDLFNKHKKEHIERFLDTPNSFTLGASVKDSKKEDPAIRVITQDVPITSLGRLTGRYGWDDTFSDMGENTLRELEFIPEENNKVSISFSRIKTFNSPLFKELRYGNPDTQNDLDSLSDLAEKEALHREVAFFTKVDKLIQTRFDELGLGKLSNNGYSRALPLQFLNFLLSSPNQQVAQYRKEFIKKTYELLTQKPLTNFESLNGHWEKIHLLLRKPDSYRFFHPRNNELFDIIDSGRYPAKELATMYGFPNIKKKQFETAMQLFGEGHLRGEASEHNIFGGAGQLMTFAHAKKAFALAKIPPEWLMATKEIPLYSPKGVHLSTQRKDNEYSNITLEDVKIAMISSLQVLGEKLDALDGKDDKQSKLERKNLAKQWAWLSASGLTMEEKLERFDKRYKMESTFHDYRHMLAERFKTVFLRTLSSFDADFSDTVAVDIDDMSIEYDEEAISNILRDHLNENYEPDPSDDFDEEPLSAPYDDVENIDTPTAHTFSTELYKHALSLKDMAEKNMAMHKTTNALTQKANKGYKANLVWQPITDNPVILGNKYEITTITNRLELLEEGEQMNHCVFSYLNHCLTGQSIILSARDITHPEKPRVATVELVPSEDGEGGYEITIEQCFGKNNNKTPDTQRVENLLEDWVSEIECGNVETNLDKIINPDNAEKNEEVLLQAEASPLEHGGITLSIPFEGDGAYLAYYSYNEYAPESLSYDSIMAGSYLMNELYYGSSFKTEIEMIETLAKEWDCSPVDVVHYKINHDIKGVNELSSHYKEQLAAVTPLREIIQQNSETLTPWQLREKCNDFIAQNHGNKILDFTGDDEALLSPSFDWLNALKEAPKKANTITTETQSPGNSLTASAPRL